LLNLIHKFIQIQALELLYPIIEALCQIVGDVINFAMGPELASCPYPSMALYNSLLLVLLHPLLSNASRRSMDSMNKQLPKMIIKYLPMILFLEVHHQMQHAFPVFYIWEHFLNSYHHTLTSIYTDS
jgi:hypothetical protein